MNFPFVLLVCIAAVNAQRGQPPSPSSVSTGSAMASAIPTTDPGLQESPVVTIPSSGGVPTSAISPPRPKGCSPGCGPKDICAELGMSYCRPGQSCSVCIKMDSIRFPASAVYSMFQPKAPTPQPYQPIQTQVPVQTAPQSTADLITQIQNTQQNLLAMDQQQQQQQQLQMSETSAFSYTQPTQQVQQPNNQFSSYYNTQPANNNLDIFGFPIQQQQQQQGNSFNSMFPFLWLDGFGMGF